MSIDFLQILLTDYSFVFKRFSCASSSNSCHIWRSNGLQGDSQVCSKNLKYADELITKQAPDRKDMEVNETG